MATKENNVNIPNILTIFRMFMVIPFLTLMTLVAISDDAISYSGMNARTTQFVIAGVIFLVAMCTDFLDGYIARKYNQQTTFGALFDPLADKWMTTTAFVLFAVIGIIPVWVLVVFVLRDLLVDASKNIAAKQDIKVNASKWGKLKTVAQSVGAVVLFLILPALNVVLIEPWLADSVLNMWLINIPIFIAVGLSTFSGYDYFKKIMPYL